MNRCILCGNEGYRILFKKKFQNKDYKIVRCSFCRLVYLIPRPSKEENKKLYDSEYFQGRGFDKTVDYSKEYKEGNIVEYERIFKLIRKYRDAGTILDVGCGMGGFLDLASKSGWKVYGLEISEYAAGILKERFGEGIVNSAIKEGLFKDDFFDVINMMEIIEHLLDPIESLKVMRKYLKSGGILLVQTGNIESFLAKIKGKNWAYILVPGHTFYFSPQTVRMALEKAGFKVERVLPPNDREESSLFKTVHKLLKKEDLIKKVTLGLVDTTVSFKEKIFSDGIIVIARKP